MEFKFYAKPNFNVEESNFLHDSPNYKDGFYCGYLIRDGKNAYLINGVTDCNSEYIAIEEWVPVDPDTVFFETTERNNSINLENDSKDFLKEAKLKPPFKFDEMGMCIFDSNSTKVLDVRGWGHFQYLPEGEKIQDRFGQFVADALNEKAEKNDKS